MKFGLTTYSLPKNYLVPRVPQRLQYLMWIDNLLKRTTREEDHEGQEVSGFDIGVGSNCIYPILAISKLKYKMEGSEVNPDSIKWANE